MSYLKSEDCELALKNMKSFHDDLCTLYAQNGIDIFENLGRRNILLSQLQEKCFAEEIKKKFSSCTNNGKTGQADILIPEIQKELECKLTSPLKTGSISFQTDGKTLELKKRLDFLYIVADRNFEKFCVLFFQGLERSDFHKESPGSRGKVRMNKAKGMEKCKILWGNAIDKKEEMINKYMERKKEILTGQKINSAIEKELNRISSKILMWENKNPMYKFELSSIMEQA